METATTITPKAFKKKILKAQTLMKNNVAKLVDSHIKEVNKLTAGYIGAFPVGGLRGKGRRGASLK